MRLYFSNDTIGRMRKFFKVLAENRKARFDYSILETFEAGIALSGTEVKSVRSGKANLKDSFGRAEKGEIWIYGLHITPYKFDAFHKDSPLRPRKLLFNKNEIRKLIGGVSQKGFTIVPLKLYLSGDWVKIEVALAKAKKTYDKKEALKKKEVEREIRRNFLEVNKR